MGVGEGRWWGRAFAIVRIYFMEPVQLKMDGKSLSLSLRTHTPICLFTFFS